MRSTTPSKYLVAFMIADDRLTNDFDTNKRIIDDIAVIQSKRIRNKIAGFTTHLMARIAKGPVRGVSLKLQEEERERRMDFIPEKSAIQLDDINKHTKDKDVRDLIKQLKIRNLIPGRQQKQEQQ